MLEVRMKFHFQNITISMDANLDSTEILNSMKNIKIKKPATVQFKKETALAY